jgi:hypothetical protein
MSGVSATGSANLGLLRQCVERLNAIKAAADVEPVVAAMSALTNLIHNDAENRTRAGTAGAVEAVAAAMRAHAGSAGVQEAACTALMQLTFKGAENVTRAGTAGVGEAVAAAMRAHAGSADVQNAACMLCLA